MSSFADPSPVNPLTVTEVEILFAMVSPENWRERSVHIDPVTGVTEREENYAAFLLRETSAGPLVQELSIGVQYRHHRDPGTLIARVDNATLRALELGSVRRAVREAVEAVSPEGRAKSDLIFSGFNQTSGVQASYHWREAQRSPGALPTYFAEQDGILLVAEERPFRTTVRGEERTLAYPCISVGHRYSSGYQWRNAFSSIAASAQAGQGPNLNQDSF